MAHKPRYGRPGPTEDGDLEASLAEIATTVASEEREQRARPLLHPEMGKLYREWVVEARDGLRDPARRNEAMAALRQMVSEIVLTPNGEQLKIELASMLAAASPSSDSENLRHQVKLVAGAGFEPATFGL